MENSTALIALGGGWIAYFGLHSLLASQWVKRRLTTLKCYRLGYNLIALTALLPIVGLESLYQGDKVIQWQAPWSWLMWLMTVSAMAIFIWTLRYYDLSEFSGWRQCRQEEIELGKFVISPPHRFVRHPWYSCALVLIWCRNMDLAELLSTLLISAYLVIGSRLEERRLLNEFGESYQSYLREVPGLIPLPWRRLSRERAEQITSRRPSR